MTDLFGVEDCRFLHLHQVLVTEMFVVGMVGIMVLVLTCWSLEPSVTNVISVIRPRVAVVVLQEY